jgi:serine/threonine-protein kinase
VSADSDDIITYLDAVVTGNQTFRIDLGDQENDYGFNPLASDETVANAQFEPRIDEDLFYLPHCDTALVPVVSGGRLEGEAGYDCTTDGDCHLTVLDTDSCLLFEMWKADDVDTNFRSGCLAVWDTANTPGDELRGLSCTSADAAGLPILPLLVTPDEIAAGQINHALRFILPNEAVARDLYVRPATHNPLSAGEPTRGPGTPPPYGVRLRLRADFDTSSLSPGARAMAEALQEYGMFHADGGNVTFIASNDAGATAKWSDPDVALGPNDLRDAGLAWTDFEVVSDTTDVVSMADVECTRVPIDEF